MKIIRDEQKFTITDFVWENKYSYGNYFRDDDNGPRTYKVGEKKVPSVTTILNATQSPEKKASLDAWRERVGHQEAQRIMIDASTRGTEMHYVLEQYINGKGYFNLSKKGAQARLMAHRLIEDGLGPLTKVFGSEVNLAYEDQWAGSTDLVAIYDGKPSIIDFKQSNKPKREEYIIDYYYQIAAYSLAHKKQHGEILQGFIAICTKDLLFQGFKMDQSKLSEYEDKWFKRVEQYYSTLSIS
jgi:genome maintenance exonuclease 1